MPLPKTPPPRRVGLHGRRLASLRTAAAEFDMSEKTLRRWIREGKITGYIVGTRTVKVDLNEIDRVAVHVIPPAVRSA